MKTDTDTERYGVRLLTLPLLRRADMVSCGPPKPCRCSSILQRCAIFPYLRALNETPTPTSTDASPPTKGLMNASLAEMAYAPRLERGSWGFDSLTTHQVHTGVFQSVECVLWEHAVAGSSPVSRTVVIVYWTCTALCESAGERSSRSDHTTEP